jgi:hypothetical protein
MSRDRYRCEESAVSLEVVLGRMFGKSGVDGVFGTGNGELSTRLGGTPIKAEMEDDRNTAIENA